jgi:hypothetical protein
MMTVKQMEQVSLRTACHISHALQRSPEFVRRDTVHAECCHSSVLEPKENTIFSLGK